MITHQFAHQHDANPLSDHRLVYKFGDQMKAASSALFKRNAEKAVSDAQVTEGVKKNWRFGKWLIRPKGLWGLIPRVAIAPIYAATVLPYAGIKAAGGATYDYAKTSSYWEPGKKFLKNTTNIPLGAYHLAAGPTLEPAKSWFIRFPMYAISDNIMTGLRAMWNIPSTAIGAAAKTTWETIKAPVNVPWQFLKGVKGALWNAPKAALAGDSRKALHHVISPATLPGKAITQPFEALGRGVGAVTGEIGITGFSYGANISRAAYTPVDSTHNSYKRIHKGLKTLGKVGEIFTLGSTRKFRDRIGEIWNRPKPLDTLAKAI